MAAKSGRFRYGLRTLLLLVLVFALVLGSETHRVRKQRAAVQTIYSGGGIVRYDYEWEELGDGSWLHHIDAQPNAPRWLRHLLGDDYFTSVMSVHLINVRLEEMNEVLAAVEQLDDLRFLAMQYQPVDDTGLLHIRDLSQLQVLHLAETNVTDSGMSNLAGLADLRTLSLDNTAVSDTGLASASIETKTQLRELRMMSTNVSDASLTRIESLPNLRFVSCADTRVTLDGAQRFRIAHPNVELSHYNSE